jgi:two-component system, response regulator
VAEDYQAVEVLLVDDDEADAELTIRGLRKEGLANRIYWARDGQEGLDFIYRQGSFKDRDTTVPKLILLDIKMPRVDGIEVLRRLKSDPATQLIPIVIMTSSDRDRDVVDSYRLGVNAYVVKPIGFENLSKAITRLGFFWMAVNRLPGSNAR